MAGGEVPAWSSDRSSLHARQRVSAPSQGFAEVIRAGGQPPLNELIEEAAAGYRAAFADGDLVEFGDHDCRYLFDLSDDPASDRAARVVAGWGRSSTPLGPRGRSRQAGFPLAPALAARGYERGHLLAHATGGGLDENLFAQAGHVNQGRSPAGRVYRRLERLAADKAGSLVFHRLIYGDGTDVPDLTQLTVGLPAATHSGIFDNRPEAWPAMTGRLTRGQRFHRDVQTAFLTGLVAADAQPEHTLSLRTGRRRVDLLVLPQIQGEVTAVVVEIKNSDWDTFQADRIRPNVRRHISQLQNYLDHYIDSLRDAPNQTQGRAGETGQPDERSVTWDAVIGVLLYPKRPRDPVRAQLVEAVAFEQALTVIWYDETEWRRQASAPGDSTDG